MPRGGQILRSGRYQLDAAGRLRRWRPRSRVDAVAIVTVRARRIRIDPTPVEICGVVDTSFDLDKAFHELVAFEVPAPIAAAEVADAASPAPSIDLPVACVQRDAALVAMAARPRHTPPPKISLKDVPSGMEQLAERWRGAP